MARISVVGVLLMSLVAMLYSQRLIWLGVEGLGELFGIGWPRLSDDGRVVVLDPHVRLTDRVHPAIWTEREGWWYLKRDGGLTRDPREALAIYGIDTISYDGSMVVGSEYPTGRLFIWRRGVGVEYLRLPPGAVRWGYFPALSWDGNWLAGDVAFPRREGGETWWGVRISLITGQVEDTMPCCPSAMSASGHVVVGSRYFAAWYWREGEGVRYVPWASFEAVSADGAIAGGDAIIWEERWGGPIRWWADESRIERLTDWSWYSSTVSDMSADGRVVVGAYQEEEDDPTFRAFIWEEGVGMASIDERYAALFREIRNVWVRSVHGISADGRYILLHIYPDNMTYDRVILDRFGYQGDVDGDDCVDDGDLLRVLFAFGQSGRWLREDVNYDRVVDEADLLIVLGQFGQGCGR